MIESNQLEYLRFVFQADSASEASVLLDRRQAILADPEIVFPDTVGASNDPYVLAQNLCNRLRNSFWIRDSERISAQIQSLLNSRFPDINYFGRRLERLLRVRGDVLSVNAPEKVHQDFLQILRQVLVADAASAHRLREQLLDSLRPEGNAEYKMACRETKAITQHIISTIPALYELEKPWLDEIRAFDPKLHIKDESFDGPVGCVLLICITVFFIVNAVWISSIFDR